MTESKPPVSARVVRTNRSAASTAAAPPSVPAPPPPRPSRPRRPRTRRDRDRDRGQPTPEDFAAARGRMVERQLRGRGIADERVLAAMAAVPRERFVLPEDRATAYDDTPLAIGYGQTISQPYIVALQLELLELRGDERLLEVGRRLGLRGRRRRRAWCARWSPRSASAGSRRGPRAPWPPSAPPTRACSRSTASEASQGAGPFDAILVSAAAERFPERLYHELAAGGRIVVPVGDERGSGWSSCAADAHGPEVTHGVPCRFVPLLEGAS